MTPRIRALALAAALVLPVSLVACGDDGGGGGGSKSDLVDSFKKSGATDKQANCMADAVENSKLSADGKALLTGGKDPATVTMDDFSAADQKVYAEVSGKVIACFADDLKVDGSN